MKKQIFIIPMIACFWAISVNAQNTPIDDFLKKYSVREGVTSVSMSHAMLQSIFETYVKHNQGVDRQIWVIPEAYSSVSVLNTDQAVNMFADLKRTLLSSKYEQVLDQTTTSQDAKTTNVLSYFMKKATGSMNEIVVLRQQNNQFSAIYIKGDMSINNLNAHLNCIKGALVRMGANHPVEMMPFGHQFAYTIPSFEHFDFPKFDKESFRFNMDDFKLNMENLEESMQKIKEKYRGEEFQHHIQDAIDEMQKRIKEVQQQDEDE